MNRAEAKRRQAVEISNILALGTLLLFGSFIGDNGITYVIVAAEICALAWSAVAGGLSDVLGKVLRSKKSKGQSKNTSQIRRSAMMFHMVLGGLVSVLLFFLAGAIAQGVFKVHYSVLIIKALAPIIFLRSVSAVLLGFFQGEGSEFPTMISGMMRQILHIGFGILFSKLLGTYGEKVSTLLMEENYTAMYGGVGFAIGVVVTEVLIILFLALIYHGMSSRWKKKGRQEAVHSIQGMLASIKTLCIGRWPQSGIGILSVLPLLAGILFANGRGEKGLIEYGLYAGKYLVICGIAAGIISVMTIPAVARIYISFRKREHKLGRMVFQGGVHISLVHGIFASVFVAVMGQQFAALFCEENAEVVRKMLLGGSSAIACMALSLYFCRVLQAGGRRILVLGAAGIADVLFVIFAMILSGVGKAGILSLVYGGIMSLFVFCILVGMLSYRQIRMRVDWLNVFIVPLGAGSAAGLLGALLSRAISPHLDAVVSLLVVFLVSGAVYWIMLLFLRNFKEEELEVVAGGGLLTKIGQMLHVFSYE